MEYVIATVAALAFAYFLYRKIKGRRVDNNNSSRPNPTRPDNGIDN
jgi:hypothetical protein